MPRLLPAFLLAGLLLPPAPCRAHPFVEHLEPPVLQRGKTTRLRAVGSGLARALDLWTSLPAGKVKATPLGTSKPDSAAFDVRVADDAPVGLFGLRVATSDGLSNVHLFLIDDLPVRPAPDSEKAPAKVELPCALWGRFREARVDRFRIAVRAGQVVSFEAVGNRLGKEVDPLVTIRDARGRFVAERDNDPGLYFDCRFAHRFAAAGEYTIEMRDSRYQGHPHGFYVLRMGRFPAARVAVPAAVRPGKAGKLFLPELNETLTVDVPAAWPGGQRFLALRRPGDDGSAWLPVQVGDAEPAVAAAEAASAKTAVPAKVPGQLCGVLTKRGERQFFRLELKQGQAIHATGHGRWLNSPIDMELTLTDDAGRLLRRAGDGPDETVRLDFTAPKAGIYCLAVRDLTRDEGPACAYRIEVRDGAPGPAVVAEVEGLTVPRDGYQIVPLTVARNGHAGPLALRLDGAPAGVTLTPAEIPAGASALVCKLSAGPAAPLGLHTLRIWAQPAKGAPVLVHTRPMVDRQLLNVDLIPYSLREDQRRLPPSVSDRLALQITEAAPFTVELAQPKVVLPRYQQAPVPLVTTRKPGFEGPIHFTARGGQLADKAEGRTRVYAEFPQATAKALKVAGSVHSRILANLGTTRIEVLATAAHAGRTVSLIRTFELEIRTAFAFAAPPPPLRLKPGSTAKVRIQLDRVKSFAGPVTVQLSPAADLELPARVVVPRGQDSVEVEVKASATAAPGRRNINLAGTADVDGFEEEQRGRIDVDIARPETAKK